ncbi:hypothetical protein [uncultured Sphingomonas sp.]|uniref:hypothetical protein n=1 Tax=uncultured Sphingomonas sp. TaxID=158754 RepID=UPI0035C9BD0A
MFRRFARVMLATAALVPGAAQAGWYQGSSQHFVVYSNDSQDNVKAYTAKLERFDKAMRVWHVTPDDKRGPASRVTIFVVGSVGDVQKLAGRSGVAGFYIGRAEGSVAFVPRSGGDGDLSAQAILFHEYTHHWMFSNWSDAAFPYWFAEGFAELHATAIMRPDGSVTFGAAPDYRRYTVGKSNLMPAGDLLRVKPSDNIDGASRDAVYSRGWLLLDYLTFDDERRGQLSKYITAINSGTRVDEAAKLLGNPGTLDQRMTNWGKRSQLPSYTANAADLKIGDVAVRPLSAGEAALMPVLIMSRRGVDAKRAAEAITLARRLATGFPDDAGAQNALAEAEFDAANSGPATEAMAGFQRAEAAADRARAADPRSIHALLYKGQAMQAQAEKEKSTDPARWQAIRKWYLAANKLDTEDPEPLILYYQSFRPAGEKPTANADNAMVYAYVLAPYDSAVRVAAARVLLAQNKVKDARVALAPVAYNSEAPGLSAIGGQALAAIDKGDIDGAIKLLAPPADDKKNDPRGSEKKS